MSNPFDQPDEAVKPTVDQPAVDSKAQSAEPHEATFEHLIEQAINKARNDSAKVLLSKSKDEYEKLMKNLESEDFIREQLTKHIELRLIAARNLK